MPKNQGITWKKYFLKIPDIILNKVQSLTTNESVVSTLLRIPIADIQNGTYEHIGITWNTNGLRYERQILPNLSNGKWSKTNLIGKKIKLKDLPKIEKVFTMISPNYGDWSLGEHEVNQTRMVYQTKLIPAKNLWLDINLIGMEPESSQIYDFKIKISEILNRTAPNFDEDLFYNINLLQENTGHANVFEVSATDNDYLNTRNVNWEILPPGTRDNDIPT